MVGLLSFLTDGNVFSRYFSQCVSTNRKKSEAKKKEIRNSNTQINNLCLIFKSFKWNSDYISEHDPLFKWYIGATFLILNGMGLILILTSYNTR